LQSGWTIVYARTYGAQWMERELLNEKSDQADTYRGNKDKRNTTRNQRTQHEEETL
jgi:hypothetical protein